MIVSCLTSFEGSPPCGGIWSASDLLNEWVAESVSDPLDFKCQVLCQIPLRPLSNILNCVSFRLLRQTTIGSNPV